jgi:3-dehydroquinate dehydratase/shikimate dehydrogenase
MAEICLSLSGSTLDEWIDQLEADRRHYSMVELRMDLLDDPNDPNLKLLTGNLNKAKIPFIWTVRYEAEKGQFKGSEEERLKLLQKGVEHGATYIDVELQSNLAHKLELGQSKKLISFHNFEALPQNLEELLIAMQSCKPHLIKLAFQIKNTSELRRVLELYKMPLPCPLIAIAMGEYGEASRLLPIHLGMPWTYASSSIGDATAPGQFTAKELSELYRLPEANNETSLYCVIGNPISHSLSPAIHNQHYKKHHFNALYGRIKVDDMVEFYKIADLLNLQGVSVTVPHKESIPQFCEKSDPIKTIGSANTLLREGDHWEVRNTDIEAAIESILCYLPAGMIPRVLILGAGGVARALAHGMYHKGWKLSISNRSTEKAEKLSKELTGCEWVHWDDRAAHGFDVVVNGTSLGMSPNIHQSPMHFDGSHSGLIVFDTVYTPEMTLFLKEAKESGAMIITGREMFYRQAALQHSHWFKTAPPWESMQEILASL